MNIFICSALPPLIRAVGVSTRPGITQFTRMLLEPDSLLRTRVMLSTAALLPVYTAAVGIVMLVIWMMRASGGHGSYSGATPHLGAAGHHEAVAIAKKRLASGEITKEQYDEIMRTLGG